MSPEDFLARLLAVAGRCAFTPSDLAIWFARPRFTVRKWLDRACGNVGGHLPKEGPILVECARRLKLLEQCRDFPVPYEVLKHERKGYIEKAYINANNGGVPKRDPAKRGSVLPRSARPRAGT